ncbi:protein LURP-one-related 15 [Elaeis guineensis]|uniref:Protein LURP-one-related 15 n=1 Tax=Elaeis guineensis var. tenera TaxID=51953 RepID=A0A6I9R9Z2_ELAGV|nr:protein LURP-one-related 15 [Elaeis guineensis]
MTRSFSNSKLRSAVDIAVRIMAAVVWNMAPFGRRVAVVSWKFCAPYRVDLTVRQKALTNGDSTVKDMNRTVVFKVKGFFPYRRVLLESPGNSLVSMQKKMMSVNSRWRVYRGDSSNSKDLLFSVKKSSPMQFKTELHVFLAANTNEKACDFKIKGSYFARSCTIYFGESKTIIAQMSRQDKVRVTVHPNVDYAFVVALIVIFDEINRE